VARKERVVIDINPEYPGITCLFTKDDWNIWEYLQTKYEKKKAKHEKTLREKHILKRDHHLQYVKHWNVFSTINGPPGTCPICGEFTMNSQSIIYRRKCKECRKNY